MTALHLGTYTHPPCSQAWNAPVADPETWPPSPCPACGTPIDPTDVELDEVAVRADERTRILEIIDIEAQTTTEARKRTILNGLARRLAAR
jgi:hypothetical protein